MGCWGVGSRRRLQEGTRCNADGWLVTVDSRWVKGERSEGRRWLGLVAARRNDRTRREQASGVAGLAGVQARRPGRGRSCGGIVWQASSGPKQRRAGKTGSALSGSGDGGWENFQRRCGSAMDDELSREVEWCVCKGRRREEEARFCSQAENWRRSEKKREQNGPDGAHLVRRPPPTSHHAVTPQGHSLTHSQCSLARSVVTYFSQGRFQQERNGRSQTGQTGQRGTQTGRRQLQMKGLNASGYAERPAASPALSLLLCVRL